MIEYKLFTVDTPSEEKFLRSLTSTVVDAKSIVVQELVSFMVDYCKNEKNKVMGMAAPQFGVPLSIIVINYGSETITMINPIIINSHGTTPSTETCQSIPGKTFEVKRPKSIKVKYIDTEGMFKTHKCQGLDACILAHEIDHLYGIMIDVVGKKKGFDYGDFYRGEG